MAKLDPHRIVLALGAVMFIGVRLHVLDDDLPNPDIAGIVYNADILRGGGLPYVDTVEVKAPGSFFMVALSFALLGRGLLALQLVHAGWLLVGALAVWLVASDVARDHASRVRAMSAAMATAVYLIYAPMFTYNYSSWMMPAYAWAVAAMVVGLRRGGAAWFVLAGAAAMFAFVTIQRAVVLAVVLPVLWAWARRRKAPCATWRAAVAVVFGAAVVFVGLGLPYLAAGSMGAWIAGLFPVDVALTYTARADASVVAVVVGATGQLVTTFWFAVVLIAAAVVADRVTRRVEATSAADTWRVGGVWLLASVGGAAIGGGRFYLHYLVQYVPALAVLAAHPALAAMLLGERGSSRAIAIARSAVGLAVAAQLLEVGLGSGHRYEAMARRLQDGRTAAQAAGAHIAARSVAGDTIACWGWTAWRVYYWADRRAPGPIYKPLGTLTTFNANTSFSDGDGVVFVPGPRAVQYIEDFDAHPPAFFVLSPSFETTFGARPDPLQAFGPLLQRLQRDYVPDAAYGDLRLFRRRAAP